MAKSEAISNWIYNNHKALFFGAVLSYLVAVSGVFFVEFDSSFRSFFKEGSELMTTFDNIQDQYEQGENLIFYLKFADKNYVSARKMEAIQYADTMANTLPYVRYIRSLSSFQKPFPDDDAILIKYLADWPKEDQGLEGVNQYVGIQSQLKGRLISEDLSGAIVLAQLDLSDPRHQSTSELIEAAEVIATNIENKYPGIEVHIAGTAAFDDGLLSEFFRFLILSVPLSTLMVTLAVAWVFNSIWITLGGLTAAGLSLAATGGIFGWLPVTIDQTGVMGILLVLVLVVVDCVHIGSTYAVSINRSMSKEAAIKESIRANLLPVFFTTLTTSVGLITLFITGSPPFVLFAQIALVGIVLGYFYAFIFMTSLAIWFPTPTKGNRLPLDPLLARIKRLVLEKPKQIILISSVVTVIGILCIPLNTVDEDTSNYFVSGTDLDTAIELLENDFETNNQLLISLKSLDEKLITDPINYLAINDFEDWLNARNYTVTSFTVNDVIREIKGAWDNNVESTRLPQNKSEYGQLLLVYEMSLKAGQSSSEFISGDRTQTLVSVFTEDLTNHNLLALGEEIEAWWSQKGVALEVSVSGRDKIFSQLSENTVNKSMVGASIAAFIITLFLIFSFQSIKWGLFSLIPNMLPFVLLFGIWALVFGELNQATCMAFTMMLGVVVDDTIHFIIKFRDAKQRMTLDEAIGKTFDFVGFAISATTVVFIIDGIVILATSQFVPNSIMGAFLILVISLAWLYDLFLMPALLTVYYRRKERKLAEKSDLIQEAA